MKKKILILNGSPRKKGNTAVLADQLSAGAIEVGAEVEQVYLHGLDIRPCDACDYCQEGGKGCVISDDMQDLYPKMLAADAIVIASPVYWYNMTAQTKLCIDRWYALESPDDFELKGKKLSLLMVYGDKDLYSSGGITVIYTLEGICRYVGLDFDGIVHGSAMNIGDVIKNNNLMDQALQLGKMLGAAE
ncbi:MAG: flavodoxin family protein [Chloroflexi bacterium]|nr:flavodoxin family protein [Chloroflexota bacterium]